MDAVKWIGASWTIWSALVVFVTAVLQATGMVEPSWWTATVEAVGTVFIIARKMFGDNAAVSLLPPPKPTS